jgi:hypothetical protein
MAPPVPQKVGDAAIQDMAVQTWPPSCANPLSHSVASRMEANMSCGDARIRVGFLR